MNFINFFDVKKIFNSLCNLKYYISFNLFSVIGWIDFLFFSLLYLYSKSDTSGLSFVFYGGIYSVITRVFMLLFFCYFKSLKINHNKLASSKIYNILFIFVIIIDFCLTSFILYSIIYIIFI